MLPRGRVGGAVFWPGRPEDPPAAEHQQRGRQGDHGEQTAADADRGDWAEPADVRRPADRLVSPAGQGEPRDPGVHAHLIASEQEQGHGPGFRIRERASSSTAISRSTVMSRSGRTAGCGPSPAVRLPAGAPVELRSPPRFELRDHGQPVAATGRQRQGCPGGRRT